MSPMPTPEYEEHLNYMRRAGRRADGEKQTPDRSDAARDTSGVRPDLSDPRLLGPPAGWVSLSPETYDRFYDGYVALLEALTEARGYVELSSRGHVEARDLLRRIDDALAMGPNLKERQ